MLVLTRRVGERIVIDRDIIVEVLEVRGNRTVLGFTAPDTVRICKEEFLEDKDNDTAPHESK